ncbi:hypothetical protein PR202_ga00618 [Eleusine coracana subsp. coracana]|uniref:Bms1-type G domain-containing protein n=1 Tax=Eleusine coracana subsp. coracana TaxID=191504 RepID=A0AAV5BGZ7_ELECO|nr:hypothetical protein PR202_ga00618 [Eleusine coracana subsp. coracana]
MGGGRAQVNKPHKTRFASKASRHAHKVDKVRGGKLETSHRTAVKGSRAARVQRSKTIRDQKRAALLKEKRSSTGSSSTPRTIVLVGLSSSADVGSLAADLLTFVRGGDGKPTSSTVTSPTYKLRTTVLQAPYGDLTSCMELAKVADLLGFVLSANSLYCSDSSSPIDEFGSQCLSVFRAMGLPSTAVFIRDLPPDSKNRQDLKKAATSFLSAELLEDCKYYLADTKDDLHKAWIESDDSTGLCTLLVSGYLRVHNLSVNQLVHVSGAGDFQLGQIDVLKDPCPVSERKISYIMETEDSGDQIVNTFVADPSNQEPLLVENVPDPIAGEQTWPTEEEMKEADISNKQRKLVKRKLPPGTSEYQAAWIVDTDDEDGDSDNDSQDGSGMDDENLTREQIETEIKKIKEANADDEEFPDEVETPLDVPAKKWFAKYRGLKSFRTSSWDPKESLPPEYARIFAFDNFTRTQKHILAKVSELDRDTKDCAQVGSYVRLHVKNVPTDVASKLCHPARRIPLAVSGLLQHESKMSVLHFSIKKHDSYEDPIKSKEPLLFNVGFRQFSARDGEQPAIAAVGSLKCVDPDRIILKKIVLTGYPQRVSKLKAMVRYMFHNPDDVRWFKARFFFFLLSCGQNMVSVAESRRLSVLMAVGGTSLMQLPTDMGAQLDECKKESSYAFSSLCLDG